MKKIVFLSFLAWTTVGGFSVSQSFAKEKEAMTLKSAMTFYDVLKAAGTNKESVELKLQGGQIIGGQVQDVGNTMVVIGPITGREFYSALIKLDHVSAVEIRTKK